MHALSTSDCNCLALRQAARRVTQLYDQFLAPIGLRTTQFSMLARLHRDGPATINALAAELVMDRTTLGRNVLPLERDGLLEIRAGADRRNRELHITGAGRRRLVEASPRWRAAQQEFERRFGAGRATELRTLLREVVAE